MHTDIKTFEDACKVRGIDPNNLPDFSMIPEQHRQALADHYKLVIISEALNEGWKPDWNNDDEYKYYPWFDMENGFVFSVRLLQHHFERWFPPLLPFKRDSRVRR